MIHTLRSTTMNLVAGASWQLKEGYWGAVLALLGAYGKNRFTTPNKMAIFIDLKFSRQVLVLAYLSVFNSRLFSIINHHFLAVWAPKCFGSNGSFCTQCLCSSSLCFTWFDFCFIPVCIAPIIHKSLRWIEGLLFFLYLLCLWLLWNRLACTITLFTLPPQDRSISNYLEQDFGTNEFWQFWRRPLSHPSCLVDHM